MLNTLPPIDVVIPVYQNLTITQRCLESVIRHRQRQAFVITVIDDASPDPEIASFLDEQAASGRIRLLRHSHNQGFVAAVNRGLALHPDRDVVLLNSDTEVNGNWLDRLANCAYAHEHIGTVTPFSNNATICSYPRFCVNNTLSAGLSLAAIDLLFQRANAGRWLEIPTAVGFCMYIRRACLQAVGNFNERTFGLGYGEENDFCMRAAQKGWRHALCADTYVYHVGGVSFGQQQRERQARAQELLLALHPDYGEQVEAFIRNDPAKPFRTAVDCLRVALGPEQALQVLQEHDDALSQVQETRLALEQGLRNAELLLTETREEGQRQDQALAEAQRYVREREADIDALHAQIHSVYDQLAQLQAQALERMAQLESLRAQNENLTAQLDTIHASRLWRYTQFLRRS